MNMYQLINNLPVGLDFTNKTKNELNLYGEWFKANRDLRLEILIKDVHETKGYENWIADYTPESLKVLGAWLKENVKTEKLSSERYKEKRAKVPDHIEITDWEMTAETYSRLIDTGIYFGESFIHTHPGLKWEQYFSKIKNDANHGHFILKGFGKRELNPLRVLKVLGSGLSDGSEGESSLFELYEVWNEYLK